MQHRNFAEQCIANVKRFLKINLVDGAIYQKPQHVIAEMNRKAHTVLRMMYNKKRYPV